MPLIKNFKMSDSAKDGLKKFISGGVGGVCAVVSGHPFDTVKVSSNFKFKLKIVT